MLFEIKLNFFLFTAEHMRHRLPKNEQDSFYFPQQSQDCEKTVVEPDLTNGLIRIPDSDEEFDEDDVDDDDDEETNVETPPAAHTQPPLSIIKTEETRSLLRPIKDLHKHTNGESVEKQAEDLSKKSTTTSRINSTATTTSASISSMTCANSSTSISSAITSTQHKKRSVSPPPLYNKAHHIATTALTAAALSKERDEYPPLNGSSLHGSHEHLNFTKHSYANGLIPALKLKRPRLSEDSNFNGSSTMDNSSALVPEDDDYHYLLSLHPYMKQLNAAQKLRIRTKIQKLIFKELYKEDLEETK